MKIRRQRSPERFTVVDNELVETRAFSYRALGVLAYLLSRPDGWETDSKTLARDLEDSSDRREGRDAVRAALTEIETAGYLHRERVQDKITGRWSTVTTVSDRPRPDFQASAPTPRNPKPGKPNVGFLGRKNQTTEPNYGTKALDLAVGDQPPPVVTSVVPRAARSGEEASTAADRLAALGDVGELCAEVRCIRREEDLPVNRWSDHNIRRAIIGSLDRGYPPAAIPDALRELARDPGTQTPGRLPYDGDWWTAVEADTLRRRRLEQAARARRASAEAERRRARDCRRCAGTGAFTNFVGKQVRCDHVPDVDDEERPA